MASRLLSALKALLPSSEPQLLYTAQLVLRVALALRRQGCEVGPQELPLIIQLVSLPAPLPLLALRLAMEQSGHCQEHVTSFGEARGRGSHSSHSVHVFHLSSQGSDFPHGTGSHGRPQRCEH